MQDGAGPLPLCEKPCTCKGTPTGKTKIKHDVWVETTLSDRIAGIFGGLTYWPSLYKMVTDKLPDTIGIDVSYHLEVKYTCSY